MAPCERIRSAPGELPRSLGYAPILDRSGMRRAWLRGRVNIHKRYLIHVAGYNLGLIMQVLTGAGTLRACSARQSAWLVGLRTPNRGMIALLCVVLDDQTVICTVSITPAPFD